MAVARMKKLTIIGHRSAMSDVVSSLQEMGSVQIINQRERLAPEDPGAAVERAETSASAGGAQGGAQDGVQDGAQGSVEARLSRVAHCIAYLGKFENTQKGLIEGFMGQKMGVPASRFAEVVRDFDETPVYEACVGDEQAAAESRTERARLESQATLLEEWKALDVPVEEIGESDDVCVLAAVCRTPDYALLEDDLRRKPVHLDVIGEAVGTTRFVAFYLPGDVSVGAAFSERSVSRVTFGDLSGTASSILEESKARLRELDDLDNQVKARAAELLKNKTDLQILFDYLAGVRAREQARQKFAETGCAFAIEGWVKERDLSAVESRLRGLSDAVEVFAEDPGPDDNVPVSLENHPLIQPFEIVTNIYGSPKYGEQDPTPLLAPFFFIFFGLALTDAAYGIVLALAFWYLMKKYRIPREGRRFFHLMIYGGISTAIFGAMAGGWFGNLIDFAPKSWGFLRTFRQSFFVLDPMLEPLTFMVISLLLGVIQVWFGLFVKMYSTMKAGAVRDAIYDQGPWLVLIPSLVLMAVAGAGIAASLSGLFSKIALLSALGIVVAQGRNTKNIIAKPFVGLYALYGGVGYFSDILSYTRLLALGLATGVIGSVVNQIGDLARMIPVLGVVLMAVIVIGGHAFNLVINVLGAFIHSGRLQFVEFFTKFFEGGGKGFTPFKRDTKYVTIE